MECAWIFMIFFWCWGRGSVWSWQDSRPRHPTQNDKCHALPQKIIFYEFLWKFLGNRTKSLCLRCSAFLMVLARFGTSRNHKTSTRIGFAIGKAHLTLSRSKTFNIHCLWNFPFHKYDGIPWGGVKYFGQGNLKYFG